MFVEWINNYNPRYVTAQSTNLLEQKQNKKKGLIFTINTFGKRNRDIDRWINSVQTLIPFRSGKSIICQHVTNLFINQCCYSVFFFPKCPCFATSLPIKKSYFKYMIEHYLINLFVFSPCWPSWYQEYNENKQSNVSCLGTYGLGDKRLTLKKQNIVMRNKLTHYVLWTVCSRNSEK